MDTGPANPAGSDVLDLVLALHRAPTLRFELRERPLPRDLGVVLRLAAASQPLLDDTAGRLALAPTRLLEAARFFLQQMLLEPGTDAYRVLGVEPTAPFERIREHHQWLQRWLHPDRAGSAGDAAFATRLNWAWQQLRNAGKRAAYDAERAQRASAPQRAATAPHPAHASQWTTVPVQASARPGRWWRRGALAAVFGSCLVLFYIALTRNGPPPHAGSPAATLASAPAPASRTPQTASAATGQHQRAKATPRDATVLADTAPPTRHAGAAITPARKATPTTPAKPAAVARSAERTTPPPLPALPKLRVAVPAPVAALPVSQPTAKPQQAAPVALAAVASPAQPATPPATSQAPAIAPAPARAAAPEPATRAAAAVSPAVLLQRVALARHRVRSLVAYFRSSGYSVPDWRHAPAPFNAPLQRAALRQRHGLPTAATFALREPVWHVAGDSIAMDASYHVQHDREVIEHGRFHVRMTWQDHSWQVTRIQLEPHG